MKKFLPAFLFLAVLFGFAFFAHNQKVSAATSHLVISEVQIAGVGTGNGNQDFVEIYNPTSSSILLNGMRLGKKTSGTTSATIVAFASGKSVPAHGFFLWCNTSLSSVLSCDASGSGTIANDNSLAIINGSLASGTVVDAVSFGTPGTTFGEGTSLTAPASGTSVERKANSLSTPTSMGVGGVDEFVGNGEDTDNNASDFVSRSAPQPQNSNSASEPPFITPTQAPTNMPSPTSEPSATPSPTLEPSATPTPTVEASPSPTQTPSVTPSPVPSDMPTPTVEPTTTPTLIPTSQPTPSLTPTLTPTPTPTPGGIIILNSPHLICSLEYKPIKFMTITIQFPFVSCKRV